MMMHHGAPFPGKGKPFNNGPPPNSLPQPFKGGQKSGKGKGQAHATETNQQQQQQQQQYDGQWQTYQAAPQPYYDQSTGTTYWPDNSQNYYTGDDQW